MGKTKEKYSQSHFLTIESIHDLEKKAYLATLHMHPLLFSIEWLTSGISSDVKRPNT